MLDKNHAGGCLDFRNQQNGKVIPDVAPLIYVKSIMRNVERPDACEEWLIEVNDHNVHKYEFSFPTEAIYSSSPLAELCRRGVVVDPY